MGTLTSKTEVKQVTIYTDGACIGNPGPGGYGVVLLFGKHRRELAGGYQLTTNNRMEILAAIVGLEALTQNCEVKLHTDSRYVVDTMMLGWAKRWQANSWWRNDKHTEPAINADLWERLLAACEKHKSVEFIWVKGHAGDIENERCDTLAVAASNEKDLLVDTGYKPKSGVATAVTVPAATARLLKPQPAQAQQDSSALVSSDEAAKQPNNLAISNNNKQAGSNNDQHVKITYVGQSCRKCGTPVIKKIPKSKHKPNQPYYYEWYLYCPGCATMYMVEEAKVMLNSVELLPVEAAPLRSSGNSPR
jgi:ribonuclease HI